MQLRLIAVSMLLVHCSTTATINLQDKSEISGTITASSKEEIQLLTPGGTKTVPRATIQDIGHPGKFHMLLGVSLFAAGIVTFIALDQRDCRDSCAQPIAGLALPVVAGAAGAGFFFWGYSAWSDSRAAFNSGMQPVGNSAAAAGIGWQFHF